MNLHERIVFALAGELRVTPPSGVVRTHLEYCSRGGSGEVDVQKRTFLKDGIYVFDYEVKSHACPRNVDKAFQQLERARLHWEAEGLVKRVESFLVYGDRYEDCYRVVPFVDGTFLFSADKKYVLRR